MSSATRPVAATRAGSLRIRLRAFRRFVWSNCWRLARSAELLQRVATVLLANDSSTTADVPSSIYIVREAFELADPAVRQSLAEPISRLHKIFAMQTCEKSLVQLCSDERAADPMSWVT